MLPEVLELAIGVSEVGAMSPVGNGSVLVTVTLVVGVG